MDKRKICCFCERWANGGIESFLSNLLRRMDLEGMEVDIVAARLEESIFTAELAERGVRFISLSGKLHHPSNYRLFRRLLRRRQYDVVHLNLYQGMALYYAAIARQEGVPVRIAHSHNSDLRQSPARPIKLLLHRAGQRLFCGDANVHLSCSRAAAAFLFGQREATRLPNGIPIDRFRFDPRRRELLRKKLGLADCLVLGNVGRLCGQKNQQFLLQVLQELDRHCPEVRLLLVGQGEDRQMLEQRSRELGVESKVIFCGHTGEVETFLWAMDVFAMPSLFEGLPLAAVEAQAAGLRVLCAGGLSPELKLTDGLEFLPLDAGAKAWADKILTMVRPGADRRKGAEAVKEAGFDIQDTARTIETIYLGRSHGTAEDLDHRSNI